MDRRRFDCLKTLNIFFYSILLCFCVSLFWIGIHNLDLGQNVRWLNAEYNLSLKDTAVSGNVYDDTEMILLGNKQIMIGFSCGIITSIIFGGIINDKYEKKPEKSANARGTSSFKR